MDDIKKFAQTVFDEQPFTQHLGAQLLHSAPGKAEIALPISDFVKQQHGYVHGGAISYLADNALTFAGGLALGGNALTSEFKINYLKPGKGVCLIARAEALSVGKRQAVCQCKVFSQSEDGTEKLCAIAQGTIVPAGN